MQRAAGGLSCSAVVGNLLSHLFKHVVSDGGKMIPDDGRTPSVLCVFQLSAVLTNFQSIMLMSGYISGFILGRKTSPFL